MAFIALDEATGRMLGLLGTELSDARKKTKPQILGADIG